MPPTLLRLLLPLLVASLGLAGCRTATTRAADAAAVTDARAVVVRAPPQDWRAFEGRRVRIDAPLTVSGNHRLARHGELVASFGGRLFAPTQRALPGAPAAALAAGNQRRQLTLMLAPAPGTAPVAAGKPPWRNGTVLRGVEGMLHTDDGATVLHVDRPLRATPAPRPPAPRVGGDVRLASLNLQNLFNGDGRGAGFPAPRGARSHEAYLQQRGKLVAALRALDADIVALMELENDGEGPDSSLAQLVAALNADGGDWRFVTHCPSPCRSPAATLGDQPIRVGLVYRADRVLPVGPAAILTGGPFDARSRIPLAQGFRAGSGPVFTVVAVHLKSKGCSEAQGPERDQRDGQGCWNATRLDSARRLERWLKTDPTRSGSDLAAIVGDFNAYAMEAPISTLRRTGWLDVHRQFPGSYSYVYDGRAGHLDHILLTPALGARVAGTAVWHLNADEPPGLPDHAAHPGGSAHAPWRSSDHDPLLVGLRLRAP